ncbi:hypothetical protein [Thermomonas sp.]|jgi:hypothetical protein|uniref:hypothetical protein n=1 Tax=Thermomonas sp. TaxID=1971895 RepID=UPI001ECBE9DE|nr:hypothetical protein [Thermomonas sp.]HRA38466.1 hypothetical protein [Pseudomonadota bacterium]MBK6415615.1 hypothetical protein [Thermomonas sp.]MBK7206163.1 hypothetical protein [Thermomonas sp.]MBK9669854.1 hypothetical protein [Thermomonas sp.]MBL0228329.1 hypothetical protein [Thermomonas sp.]
MRKPAVIAAFALAVLLALAPRAASAQATLFYKCTNSRGEVSMQNGTPCAAGMKQEVRRIGEVKTVPVPAKKPEPAAAAAAPVYGDFVLVSGPNMKRMPVPEAATLPPPPPLFQCRTWQGDTYFGESNAPAPRCVPLQVTGIDGSAGLGAGSACEMKYDACTATPAEQLCDAWLRRLDEAEFKLKYASRDDEAGRKAAFESVEAKVKASRCSPVAPEPPAQNP